jgi:RNA polymerase sigma-32 factor
MLAISRSIEGIREQREGPMAKKTSTAPRRKQQAARPAPPPKQELVEPTEEAGPTEPLDDGELVLEQEPAEKRRARSSRVDDPSSLDELGSGGRDDDDGSASSAPLATYDALGAYLREIHRYALLSQDEEKSLAKRYFEQQDVEAAASLVTANLRLVVKIAFEYRRAYRNVMDLIQEGNIGLMQAVKKFDPYRGVKLSTYASWWIRAYILRYLLNNWRLVKIGTTQAQRRLFFNLSKEKRRLEALGIDATPEKIAEGLQVTTDEVIEMDRRLAAPEASLDAPARSPGSAEGDRSASRLDLMSNEDVPTDEALALSQFNDELHGKVSAFAETLTGREADVFRNRLWADTPETLQEIGDRYGLTREGVRQIEKRILARLRKFLEQEMGEYLEFHT